MIYARKIRDGDPKSSGKFPVGRPNTFNSFHSCCPCPVTGRLECTLQPTGIPRVCQITCSKIPSEKRDRGRTDGSVFTCPMVAHTSTSDDGAIL